MPRIHLKEFNPKTIREDRICIMVAPRGSGKSTLIRDIMYHKRHLPMGIVMSPTEEGNHFYEEMVPKSFIYSDFSPTALENLMNRQRKKVNEYQSPDGKIVLDGKHFNHIPNAFVVAEDCMADKKVWKSDLIRDLFLNGRHRKAFLLIALQYLMDLSIELRSNVDYVFVLMEDSVWNKERIWKSFFSMFPSFDMFCQVMDQCTADFGCLVLDRTIKSPRIEDKCFFYKAKVRPPFRIGCWQYWEYDRLRAKQQDEEDEFSDDAVEAVQKSKMKRAPKITVVRK